MGKRTDKKSAEYLARKYVDRRVIVRVSGQGYKPGRVTKADTGVVKGFLDDGTKFEVSCKCVILA